MVYNPFQKWTKDMLMALIKAGKRYFVIQYYHRGKVNAPGNVTHCFLMCHYDDFAVANHHLQIIKNTDPFTKIYDSTNPEQFEKLVRTTDEYSQYLFYSNTATEDWKLRLKRYERLMRSCIETELNWHPKGKEKVLVGMHSEYGMLHISFHYGSQTARFLYDKIENLPPCVMILPYSLQLNWRQSTSPN